MLFQRIYTNSYAHIAKRLQLQRSSIALLSSLHSPSSYVSRLQNSPPLKKKLGQHLLISDTILRQIVASAKLKEILKVKINENRGNILRVLEIGPGTGNLTAALLDDLSNIHIHAVEFDQRMVEKLHERFPKQTNLSIEHINFEDFQFHSTVAEDIDTPFDACVANIPYELSSIIVSRLQAYMLAHPESFQCAVLMVQDEFASRLLAKPGSQNYSRLSVNTALVCNVSSVVYVKKEHFAPQPQVNSRVIKLMPLPSSSSPSAANGIHLSVDFLQKFDTLLRICFSRKNKKMRGLLIAPTAQGLIVLPTDTNTEVNVIENEEMIPRQRKSKQHLPSSEVSRLEKRKQTIIQKVEKALQETNLITKRAVKVSVDDFLRLFQTLQKHGIDFQPSKTRHFRLNNESSENQQLI